MLKGLTGFNEPGYDIVDSREKMGESCQQYFITPADTDNDNRVDNRIEDMSAGSADHRGFILFMNRVSPAEPGGAVERGKCAIARDTFPRNSSGSIPYWFRILAVGFRVIWLYH